jgi:hypothetical protein
MLKYLGSAWAHYMDYINVPVYRKVRRIDMILALGFLICVSYYWYVAGWQWSIIGGLMYIMFLMVALWFI